MSFPAEPQDNSLAAEKVRDFPQSPGVYLMKDAAGRVIYVGKAKNLRSRAGSYFLKAAAEDSRTASWVQEIRDIDYLLAESDVDALLMEARLIKDILPKYNRDLRDDKTFPYLEIHTHEEFPRVGITRTPRDRGTKLYGPFTNSRGLRGALQVLQKIFKFRTCSLEIADEDPRWRWFRPCLLASIRQCSAPCNLRISKEEYRKSIHRLQQFLEGKKHTLLEEMRARDGGGLQAVEVSKRRPDCATRSTCWRRSTSAASSTSMCSRRSFQSIPRRGLPACRRYCTWSRRRGPSRVSTSPTLPARKRWPAWCDSSTACLLSPVIGGCGSATVQGIDDFASIHEAVSRRFQRLARGAAEDDSLPDILLIDGGKGQLHAALSALDAVGMRPATVVSLAKRRRGGLRGRRRRAFAAEPPQLCLAPAAVRPRRSPPLCPALSPSAAKTLDVGRGVRSLIAN